MEKEVKLTNLKTIGDYSVTKFADFYVIKNSVTRSYVGRCYDDVEDANTHLQVLVDEKVERIQRFKNLGMKKLAQVIQQLIYTNYKTALDLRDDYGQLYKNTDLENDMLMKRIGYLVTDFKVIKSRILLIAKEYEYYMQYIPPDPIDESVEPQQTLISICDRIRKEISEVYTLVCILEKALDNSDYNDETTQNYDAISALQRGIMSAIGNCNDIENYLQGFEKVNFGVDLTEINYDEPEAY